MFIVVANWKANLTFHEALALCKDNVQAYIELSATKNIQIVFCPSFEALYAIAQLFKGTTLAIGAQNCSAHKKGSYTGQVIATSLAEIGCTYALVGHQESRTYLQEDAIEIADKVERLLEVGVEPIVCIGETKQEYEAGATLQALRCQLDPIITMLSNAAVPQRHLCIAYEPVWAIGTGKIPTEQHLSTVFSWLEKICSSLMPSYAFRFLYGGSVTAEVISTIQSTPFLKGVLIGSASLDFKKFQNIVSSL